MSDPKVVVVEMEMDVARAKAAAVTQSLVDSIPPQSRWRAPSTPAKKANAPAPMQRWKKRDGKGNVIPARPG